MPPGPGAGVGGVPRAPPPGARIGWIPGAPGKVDPRGPWNGGLRGIRKLWTRAANRSSLLDGSKRVELASQGTPGRSSRGRSSRRAGASKFAGSSGCSRGNRGGLGSPTLEQSRGGLEGRCMLGLWRVLVLRGAQDTSRQEGVPDGLHGGCMLGLRRPLRGERSRAGGGCSDCIRGGRARAGRARGGGGGPGRRSSAPCGGGGSRSSVQQSRGRGAGGQQSRGRGAGGWKEGQRGGAGGRGGRGSRDPHCRGGGGREGQCRRPASHGGGGGGCHGRRKDLSK